ncbi:MAG TPA: phage tail protein, partial [Arenicellales bacterium]|nr:phage tail protein [Arenicellales bacterium]
DPDMDYQVNTQRASRIAGSAENNIRREIPLVLTADEARRLADRELWEAWAGRRTAKCAVSDLWVRRNPADVLGLPVAGAIVPHRLIRATRGHNGVLDIEWQRDDPEVYQSSAAGANADIPDNPIRLPGFTRLVLIDMPILRESDDDDGFYWVVSAESIGWRGAQILRSSDGGDSYDLMSPVRVRTVLGDVATALPPGPSEIWDRGNTITVELHYEEDELESVSELNVLNGANAAWLGPADGQGGEIIQFATATLVGENTYELTDLLRGRLGTEHAIDGHGADEVLVLLEPDTLGRTDYGPGDWERERLYKPVSNLISQVDTPSQTFTNEGTGKKPLSPVHVDGTRDGANDLTITWIRRTRLRVPGLGYGPVPLGEETEAYEIDILAGSPATVVRTISATSPSAVYTAAQQTADGLTPGDPVSVAVYQISGTRGRGFGAFATV